MKAIQVPMNERDYDAAAAAVVTYVDEDDYTIDCDALDDMEILSAGLGLRRFEPD